jgi:glycosyltransferase involved in cell wall biosynthesis
MNYIKVSVVIPTYRRPHLLVKTIRALLDQEFPADEYEIIVVTDGPDEKTLNAVELLREISGGTEIICLSLNNKRGPAAARNKGWRKSNGVLVIFTDDDCLPMSTFVSAYWDAFKYYKSDRIAFTGTLIVPVSAHPTDYELNTAKLETAEFVTANCALTKTALTAVTGFDESFTMAWREDSDLQFKLFREYIPIYRIHLAIVIHPVRKAEWGVSLKEQKKGMYDVLLYKKYPDLFRKRIMSRPSWDYYLMITLILAAVTGSFILLPVITVPCIFVWLMLTTRFIYKRLKGTSHSFNHVSEMIFTSMFIPFLSVFWKMYGAFRFKTWYL